MKMELGKLIVDIMIEIKKEKGLRRDLVLFKKVLRNYYSYQLLLIEQYTCKVSQMFDAIGPNMQNGLKGINPHERIDAFGARHPLGDFGLGGIWSEKIFEERSMGPLWGISHNVS